MVPSLLETPKDPRLSNSTSCDEDGDEWPRRFKLAQLKQILRARAVQGEMGCVDRPTLERLAAAHIGSLQTAQEILVVGFQVLPTTQAGRNETELSETHSRTARCCFETRPIGVQLCPLHPTADHVVRMERFQSEFPQAFDDPLATPRSAWWTNPRFLSKQQQMPHYHRGFRRNSQLVLDQTPQVLQGETQQGPNHRRYQCPRMVPNTRRGQTRGTRESRRKPMVSTFATASPTRRGSSVPLQRPRTLAPSPD